MKDQETTIINTTEDFIKNAVHSYLNKLRNENRHDEYNKAVSDDFSVLHNILKEYLNDFVVIGHTIDGQRIFFQHAKNPLEMDSLIELSRRSIHQLTENGTLL